MVDRAAATAAEAAAAANVRAARRSPHPRDRGFSTRPPVDQWWPVERTGGPAQGDRGFIHSGRAHAHTRQRCTHTDSRAARFARSPPPADGDDAAAAESADGHAVTSTNDDILLCRCPAPAFALVVLSPPPPYGTQHTVGVFPVTTTTTTAAAATTTSTITQQSGGGSGGHVVVRPPPPSGMI